MTDDLADRGLHDRVRVDIHEVFELQYWTKKFGCTPKELLDAVSAVGVMAEDVEGYLKKERTLKGPRTDAGLPSH